jgi:hypothetical protein
VLATATFAWAIATFNYDVTAFTTYRVEAWSYWPSYTTVYKPAVYPIIRNDINWTGVVQNGAVISSTFIWNIIGITFAKNVFVYLSSSVSEDFLYSKTSAENGHPLPDIPRFTRTTTEVWLPVLVDFEWITDTVTGIANNTAYYLSNTPWLLTTTPTRVFMWVGIGNKLHMDKKIKNMTITVTASPFTYTNNTNWSIQVRTTGGTVSSIVTWGVTVATATNNISNLAVWDSMVVTYSAIPVMVYSEL